MSLGLSINVLMMIQWKQKFLHFLTLNRQPDQAYDILATVI